MGRGEGERGFCPRSSRGLRRDRPSRLRPRGGAPTPLTTLPLPPISDCACSHQPAGAGALRNPGVPICALQIPRNVKLVGRGVGEGRQKLGASHPFGKIRSSPVRRGPGWYPEPPSPSPSSFRREISVPCKCASLFIPLSFQVSCLPLAPEVRCLCRGHPHSVPLPLLIPSCVSQSPTPFGVVLHGFAVLEEMETQQSLKLVPRGQADGSRGRQAAGGVEKGRGR